MTVSALIVTTRTLWLFGIEEAFIQTGKGHEFTVLCPLNIIIGLVARDIPELVDFGVQRMFFIFHVWYPYQDTLDS